MQSTIIVVQARDLPAPHTRDGCRKCSCATGYLARYIKVNRSVALRWVCDWCEDYATAGDLPRNVLPANVDIGNLPIRANNADEPDSAVFCVVCDSAGAEFHHWAPTAIFPHWPGHIGAYLCIDHHREWHQVMRDHGLRWPNEQAA